MSRVLPHPPGVSVSPLVKRGIHSGTFALDARQSGGKPGRLKRGVRPPSPFPLGAPFGALPTKTFEKETAPSFSVLWRGEVPASPLLASTHDQSEPSQGLSLKCKRHNAAYSSGFSKGLISSGGMGHTLHPVTSYTSKSILISLFYTACIVFPMGIQFE